MTLDATVAVLAVLLTLVNMGAAAYSYGSRRDERLLKAELLGEVKDLMQKDRHDLRRDMQSFVAKLQGELDADIETLRDQVAALTARRKP